MSLATLLEEFGLIMWVVIAFIAAAWVHATHVKADDRGLTAPPVRGIWFGDDAKRSEPIVIRNPLAAVGSYAYAAVVAAAAMAWFVQGWQVPIVLMLFVSVIMAGLMFRWFVEFNEAEEARTRSLPDRYPIRVHPSR